jgi:pilus assembly protein Flp/PilA
MLHRLTRLMNDARGATSIEYGLIASLIAIAAIGAMRGLGSKLNSTYTNVSNDL